MTDRLTTHSTNTHRSEIRFLLNGREVSVSDVGASQTLLDFLRLAF